MKRFFTIFVLNLILAICPLHVQAQTLSVKSKEALVSEVSKIFAKIKSPEMRFKFADAVAWMAAYNFQTRGNNFYQSFNGKTPKEIITIGTSAKMDTRRKLESHFQGDPEAARAIIVNQGKSYEVLSDMIFNSTMASVLQKIEIKSLSIKFQAPSPEISIRIVNSSPLLLKEIRFKISYKDPSRRLPWATESFWFELSGGIEPNEARSFSFDTKIDGEFCGIPSDARGDLSSEILSVTIVNTDGKSVELSASENKNPFNFVDVKISPYTRN